MKEKIGIIGCGNIGLQVAGFVKKELGSKFVLACLWDNNKPALTRAFRKFKVKPAGSLQNLIKKCSIIVECASQDAVQQLFSWPELLKNKRIIVISIGGIIENLDKILPLLEKYHIELYIPSGAICGIDGISSAALGKVKKCLITTTKPPRGLEGSSYLSKRRISLKNLTQEKVVFSGDVFKAVKYFPKNINVAATLYLALQRKVKVKVKIIASPFVKRNIHRVELLSNVANIKLEVENLPSVSNPKTSALTVFSINKLLSNLASFLKIGT